MCKMGGNESVDSVGKLMEGLAPLLEDINEETEMVWKILFNLLCYIYTVLK